MRLSEPDRSAVAVALGSPATRSRVCPSVAAMHYHSTAVGVALSEMGASNECSDRVNHAAPGTGRGDEQGRPSRGAHDPRSSPLASISDQDPPPARSTRKNPWT